MTDEKEKLIKAPIQPAAATFIRPDEYANLPEGQKQTDETLSNDDFCVIKAKDYFIRAVMFIPLDHREDAVNLGIWVKVNKDDFETYHNVFDDPDAEGDFRGTLANQISFYPDSLGHVGTIVLQKSGSRPLFSLSETDSDFYKGWKNGVSKDVGDQIFHSVVGK